ncbi:MAG: MASE3 domain-containing protein, partial [Lentisphaerota bacterium]
MAGISMFNYLLFHILIELFSVVVAVAAFMVAWNVRKRMDNNFLLFIVISYVGVALLDLVHLAAYKGMGVFPGTTANLPTQLWIAARYLQAVALLVAPVLLSNRLPAKTVLIAFGLIDLVLLGMIFQSCSFLPVFPDCFHEGHTPPLTPFKILSEYIITGLLLLAQGLLWRQRSKLSPVVVRYMTASVFATIFSELAFTSYISVYGPANMIGHLLKALAFYLAYKALIEAGLKSPFDILFHRVSESELRFRTLASAAFEGVVISENGRIVDVNEPLARMFRCASQDLIGREIVSLIYPEDRERVIANISKGVDSDLEHRLSRADGDIMFVEVHGKTISSGNRSIRVSAIRDITERKRFQGHLEELVHERTAKLTESEERFHSLTDNIPGIVYRCEVKAPWKVSVFSDAALAITGYPASDFLAGRLLYGKDLILSSDLPEVERSVAEGIEGHRSFAMQYRIKHADGSFRWIQEHGRAIYNQEGQAQYLDGVIFDISEQKKAEKAVCDAYDCIRQLISSANVMIVGLDAFSRIRMFNHAAEKITGYSMKELSGSDWFEKIVPKDRYPQVWETFQKYRQKRNPMPATMENPILTKTGEERIVSWQNSSITIPGADISTIS